VPAYTANNIGHQLDHSAIPWKGYMESMPGTCAESSSGRYGTAADPFAYFTNLACAHHVVPYSQLAIDASRGAVPAYSFVVPNLCHDMHDVCAPESSQCIGKTGDALQICNGDAGRIQSGECLLQARFVVHQRIGKPSRYGRKQPDSDMVVAASGSDLDQLGRRELKNGQRGQREFRHYSKSAMRASMPDRSGSTAFPLPMAAFSSALIPAGPMRRL